MKKAKLFLIALLCILGGSTFGQQINSKELVVGDKLPDVVLKKIIGFTKPTAKISDFKGKLLILDFWATWCHSCIEAFPKIDALQQQFGDKIQIMLVNTKNTEDDEQKVMDFYKKHKIKDPNFKLPSVYLETELSDFFPRETIPHYVWITKDGVVAAISKSEDVTSENIEKMLNGKPGDLKVRSF